MTNNHEIIEKLTSKDDKSACEFAEKIISESRYKNAWYRYFDEFASLLIHSKSLVRNRAMLILSAIVMWDNENKFDGILCEFLSHITDEKPITARQCIKTLESIAHAKPHYIEKILSALKNADLSKYKDSMRPLIENDIKKTIDVLTERVNE